MSNLFISYSREDYDFVQKLYAVVEHLYEASRLEILVQIIVILFLRLKPFLIR